MVASSIARAAMLALLLVPVTVYSSELCISCHKTHYSNRGRCSTCHRGNPETTRKDLAHTGFLRGKYTEFTVSGKSVTSGWQARLEQYGCRRCHLIGGIGNRFAASLDVSVRHKTPEMIVDALRHPVKAMPDFRFTEERRDEIVNTLLLLSAKVTAVKSADRQKIYFEDSSLQHVFSKKCGACHRILTARFGVLGSGSIGPNLSGLFTVYYPKDLSQQGPWDRKNLAGWLINPRAIRYGSTMLPVKVSNDDLSALDELFSDN